VGRLLLGLVAVTAAILAGSLLGENPKVEEPIQLTTRLVRSDGVCPLNRTIVSGVGNAAFWDDPYVDPSAKRRRSDVTSVHIAIKGAKSYEMLSFNEPYTVEPLIWSPNGSRLYVRVNHSQIGVFDVESQKYNYRFTLDPEFDDVTISVSSETGVERLRSNSTVSKLKEIRRGQPGLRFWIDVGKTDSIIKLLEKDRTFIGPSGIRHNVPSFGVRKVRPLNTNDLIYSNVIRKNGVSSTILDPFFDFSKTSVGGYTGLDGDIFDTSLVKIASAEKMTIDTSKNGVFVSTVVLGDHGDSEGVILNISNSKRETVSFCRSTSYFEKRLSGIAFDVVPIFGKDQSPSSFLGFLYRSKAPAPISKNLAVYFHGGPASSVRDAPFPRAVEEMLSRGEDVLLVEYSGSAISDVHLSSLARGGTISIDQNMTELFEWFLAQKSRYDRVDIVAVSFGTVPAFYFRGKINELLNSALYVTPVLQLKQFEDVTKGTRVSPQNQEIFENLIYGSANERDSFGLQLHSKIKTIEFDKRDLFIFAKNDSKSLMSDAETLTVSTYQLSQAGHQFADQSSELWDIYWGRFRR
jgi:hypothetical protein